jgi:hypothetical protein
VVVPMVQIDLHEAHAPLDHPPSHEDGVGKRARLRHLLAIELESGGRFLRESGPVEFLSVSPSRKPYCPI